MLDVDAEVARLRDEKAILEASIALKEYFRVPLEKVVDLVTLHHGQIQLTRLAEAAEFRKSLAIRAEREAMVAGKVAHASAVSRADQVKARYEELKKATA